MEQRGMVKLDVKYKRFVKQLQAGVPVKGVYDAISYHPSYTTKDAKFFQKTIELVLQELDSTSTTYQLDLKELLRSRIAFLGNTNIKKRYGGKTPPVPPHLRKQLQQEQNTTKTVVNIETDNVEKDELEKMDPEMLLKHALGEDAAHRFLKQHGRENAVNAAKFELLCDAKNLYREYKAHHVHKPAESINRRNVSLFLDKLERDLFIRELFLDPFSLPSRPFVEDGLPMVLKNLIEFTDRGVDLLQETLDFVYLIKECTSIRERAICFEEICHNIKTGTKRVFPLLYRGEKLATWGQFCLVVERCQGPYFRVVVCSKEGLGASYHPQSVTSDGRLRICPVIEFEKVRMARLLDSNFTFMLFHLGVPSKHNNSNVLYEVLLPFLVEGKTLLQASKSYSNPPWLASMRRGSASNISSILVALRYIYPNGWKRFKLNLRLDAASTYDECKFTSTDSGLIAHQIAYAATKRNENIKSPIPLDLRPKYISQRSRQKDGRRRYKHLRDFSFDFDQNIPRMILNQRNDYRFDDIHDESFCYTYAAIRDRVAYELPKNPKELQDFVNLDDLLRMMISFCHVVLNIECDKPGDRVVVLGYLYAGACEMLAAISTLRHEIEMVFSDIGLNGMTFNEMTGVLTTSSDLLDTRGQVASYFMSYANRQDEAIFDFRKLQTRIKSTEDPTLRFILYSLEIEVSDENDNSANDSSTRIACEGLCTRLETLPEFSITRDVAFLYQYFSMPLKEVENQNQNQNAEEKNKLVPKWQFFDLGGEEYMVVVSILGKAVTNDQSVLLQKHKSAVHPSSFFESPILTDQITEYDIIHENKLPIFDKYLGVEESEQMMSLLANPHLRIPGLLSFFSDDRASVLFHPPLMNILWNVMTEPLPIVDKPLGGKISAKIPLSYDILSCCTSKKGILYQELLSFPEATVVPFTNLFNEIVNLCRRALPAPKSMLRALGYFIRLAVHIEFFLPGSFVEFLLGDCLSFLCQQGDLPALCVLCYSCADTGTIKENGPMLLRWSTRVMYFNFLCKEQEQLHLTTLVQEFLVRHRKIFEGLELGDDVLDDIISSVHPVDNHNFSAGRCWKRLDRRTFCKGDISFNIHTAEVKVMGSTPISKLPKSCSSGELPKEILDSDNVSFYAVPKNLLQLTRSPNSILRAYVVALESQNYEVLLCESIDGTFQCARLSTPTALREVDRSFNVQMYLPTHLLEDYLCRGLLDQISSSWYDPTSRRIFTSDDIIIDTENHAVRKGNYLSEMDEQDDYDNSSNKFECLEDAENILFWKKTNSNPEERIIEFPRLDIVLESVSSTTNGYVWRENTSLFVVDPVAGGDIPCLRGIPYYLIVSNKAGELFAIIPRRLPGIEKNNNKLGTFVYSVDVTLRKLRPSSANLESSLLLFVLKLNAKEYNDAADIVNLCSTDQQFTSAERQIFDELETSCSQDMNPEACACRLRLFETTVLRNGEPLPLKGSIFRDLVRYVSSIGHVRPRLRISNVFLQELVRYALQQGRIPLKSNYMAVTVGQENDFSTDANVVSLKGSIGELQLPVPRHGGGGWQRMRNQAPEYLDYAIEESKAGFQSKVSFPIYMTEKLTSAAFLGFSSHSF